jgi:xylulokinase
MFLGIDIGTGSAKAVLTDAEGRVLNTASVAHEITLPAPDWAEFDAEAVGWPEIAGLTRQLLEGHDPAELAGVCVSAMGPCLIVTDQNRRPLRPTILYGIDARATDEIAELNEMFGEADIFATCGKVLSSQAVGPKMRWISSLPLQSLGWAFPA